ncbi:hypothetical protein [Natrinema sp. J7-1]|uniref:DUF6414 family protein n=1 Tax=Natrinema sp. J7-1 TaxID=1172566 RepID=UPI0012DC20F7|nr:hypothetical protein [Natrinema sp. J7-1]
MSELREFVYLDDGSLNSNLSSLGQGIPSEIVHSAEGETEKGGNAGGGFLGFSLGGKYSNIDRDAVETTMTITAPYRFQDFLEILREEGIEIHENPDPQSLNRGDVVRIEGFGRPMSLFKFEVAIKTIRTLINVEMQESMKELDEGADNIDREELEQLSVIEQLVEQFTGEKIPLRFESDNRQYGVSLDRSKMRVDPPSAFLDEPEFKLIGRVERCIPEGDHWDPIQATSILNRYLPENEASDELRRELETVADELNIPTGTDDWLLEGQTVTIHPIAVFW